MPDPVYQLGKLPKAVDDRNLMLADYLTPAAPTPPPAVDYASAVTDWLMIGNDTVGDCALAGQAHADMLWTANAEHRALAITTARSPPPTRPSPATSRAPAAPAATRPTAAPCCSTPSVLAQAGHRPPDRLAFVEVDPPGGRREAHHRPVRLPYVGVELPTPCCPPRPTCRRGPAARRQQAQAPDPHNGHCVIYCAYDESGPVAVTWGTTVKASWGFHSAYCDELYAMLSPAWLRHDPPGIDVATLTADLALVARR